MAVRNLTGNWRHSLAAVLSMASAFLALSLFQGYIGEVVGMYEDTYEKRSMLGDLLVLPKVADGRAQGFDEAAQAVIEKALEGDADAELWVPFLEVSGTASNGTSSTVFAGYGIDVQKGLRMRSSLWAWNTVAG